MAEALQFDFEYRREDETFRSSRIIPRAGAPKGAQLFGFAVAVICLAVAMALLMVQGSLTPLDALLLLIIVTYMGRMIWVGRRMNGDENSPLFGRRSCTIDNQGIAVDSENLKLWVGWPTVRDIEETPRHISIYYDLVRAIVLPKASFKTEAEIESLRETLRKHAAIRKIASSRGRLWVLLALLLIVFSLLVAVNNIVVHHARF